MVEVFKTDLAVESQSKDVVEMLRLHFPACIINFDLEDCDKVLRVEGIEINNGKIISLLNEKGFHCEELTW
jgi:hypothetical protein